MTSTKTLMNELFDIVNENEESIVVFSTKEEYEGIMKGTQILTNIINSFSEEEKIEDTLDIYFIEKTEEKKKELMEYIPYTKSSVVMLVSEEGFQEVIKLKDFK